MKQISILFCAALCLLLTACAQLQNPRADFLRTINHHRVPLSATIDSESVASNLCQIHFTLCSENGQRVPGIILKRVGSSGRRPAVMALHGTGGNKQNMFALGKKLAALGFVAVLIDGRYHGERAEGGKGSDRYNAAIVEAWRTGKEHPLYYDTVWDVTRLVDYLETRDDVDAGRIGLIGYSKGGIETYLAAAADRRIAVAVPCIGVQSFRWALENDAWQSRVGTFKSAFDRICEQAGVNSPDSAFVKRFYDRVVPGIDSTFDGPAMLPLIAPRPLLVINGDSDARTPLAGLKIATDAARAAYQEAGAEEKFMVRIQENTGHKVTPESERAAAEWFVKWLKP